MGDIAAKTSSGTKALCATIDTSPAVAAAVEGGNINLDSSDCGDASTIGTIKDVQPRQLALGGTTTLVASGTLSAEFPAGDFTFNAKALGVTVLSDGGDVCAPKDIQLPLGAGTFSYKGNTCPLAAGDVALTFETTLSSAIPSQLAKLEIDCRDDQLWHEGSVRHHQHFPSSYSCLKWDNDSFDWNCATGDSKGE